MTDVKKIRRWGRLLEGFSWTSLVTILALAIAGLCPWWPVATIAIIGALIWRVTAHVYAEVGGFYAGRFSLACQAIDEFSKLKGFEVDQFVRQWRAEDEQLVRRFRREDGERSDG
jgi:hypothetical protein